MLDFITAKGKTLTLANTYENDKECKYKISKSYSFVKNGRGLSVDRSKAYKYENLAFNFVDRKVEPLLVTVEYNESPEIHLNTHQGQEFHYCLEGSFELQIGDHVVTVEEGDSAYFDSRQPHGMRALNGKCAKILVITI